jgi:hypothetical protein
MKSMRASMLACGLLLGVLGFSTDAPSQSRFVPNSQEFWDSSMNWTTNYGPAYRDTVEARSNFLACSGQFALCFHSGAEPLLQDEQDGGSMNCTHGAEQYQRGPDHRHPQSGGVRGDGRQV